MIRIPAYDLSSRNTFRMKVSCALYIEIEAEEELQTLDWSSLPQPVMVLGGGSNLLFTADYFPGTVLHIGISGRWQTGHLVTCGAGTVFDEFCAWAAEEGLWGPENLSLIPGECGASAVQNIGAYGVEVKDILADIRAWDRLEGRFVHIDPAVCGYGYRTSKFKTEWKGRYIITAVTYRLSKEPKPHLDYGGLKSHSRLDRESPLSIREAVIAIRQSKLPDPAEFGSAGSFFCNPVVSREVFDIIEGNPPHYELEDGVKVPAAWLIEQCGFKGARLGGAQVWEKQPLVIVNASGDASARDILDLENQIIEAVKDRFGITLKPEVEHVKP